MNDTTKKQKEKKRRSTKTSYSILCFLLLSASNELKTTTLSIRNFFLSCSVFFSFSFSFSCTHIRIIIIRFRNSEEKRQSHQKIMEYWTGNSHQSIFLYICRYYIKGELPVPIKYICYAFWCGWHMLLVSCFFENIMPFL